jgi:putative hydrolase of the HAD superfamily
MSAPIRLVSFDAGGVLVFPNWERVSAAVARQGIDVSAEALRRADAGARYAMDQPSAAGSTNNAGHAAMYFGGALAAAGVDRSTGIGPALDEVRAEHGSRNLWETTPPEAGPMLRRLRDAGFKLVVVSNSDGRLQSVLDNVGLTEYFDAVIDSQLVGAEKPDPAIFLGVLAAMGVDANEAVHVGDFYTIDVLGARAAGMLPVLLDPDGLHEGRDCVRVRDLTELEAYLLRLAGRGSPA